MRPNFTSIILTRRHEVNSIHQRNSRLSSSRLPGISISGTRGILFFFHRGFHEVASPLCLLCRLKYSVSSPFQRRHRCASRVCEHTQNALNNFESNCVTCPKRSNSAGTACLKLKPFSSSAAAQFVETVRSLFDYACVLRSFSCFFYASFAQGSLFSKESLRRCSDVVRSDTERLTQ